MRRLRTSVLVPSLATVLAGVLTTSSTVVHAASLAPMSGLHRAAAAALLATQEAKDPAKLYDEGRKAYRLGKYEEAVKLWEEAYDLSDNALVLFNIGLAYKEWYGVANDADKLRKSKAVFQNFLREAARDPERFTEEQKDAEARLAEVEQQLAAAEQAERDAAAAGASGTKDGEGPEQPATDATPSSGPDPGRKLRLAGIGAMAGGGVFFLAGVGLGAAMLARGGTEEDNLNAAQARQIELGCTDASTDSDCLLAAEEERVARANGRTANTLSIVGFAALGGIGVAGLVAGGVLFAKGKRQTDAWKGSARLQVAPMLALDGGAPALTGLQLRARF
jgi:tetratricopeptide (TPR) repeat protein